MMKIKIFSRLFFATLLFGVTSFVAVNNVWAADEKPWNKAADFKLEVPEWTGNWSGNFQADRARELILDKAKVTNTDSVNDDVKNNGSNDEKKGSATSGNVAYTGPNSLTGEYYYGCNTGGNIFQQLACRAGRIGLGLRSVGYIIAGFGLLVFSLSALFGKVKWNVFVTIMFSVFLLSMTFYVINTFTSQGNSAWIAGVQATDIPSADTINSNVQDTDKSNLPAGEEAPK